MALLLVTGPANAEKARVVLERVRAARASAPLLVVPTAPDVERYRRELAEDHDVVLGVRVETFAGLVREVARRAGVPGAPVGPVARERLIAAAAARAALGPLATSAATPGFARAAGALLDELGQARIGPARWRAALRAWAGEGDPYAEGLGALHAAYRAELARLGLVDGPLHVAAALDALRADPAAWRGTPVALYGFDDLEPLQREAVLALAATGADVTVALPHEAGRHAFAPRAATYHALAPAADRVEALGARADHYAPGARGALHHLERALFEDEAPPPGDEVVRFEVPDAPLTLFDELAFSPGFLDAAPIAARDLRGEEDSGAAEPARVAAGDAVAFLEGGSERAELELVAAEVAALLARGVPADEVAVVVRRPEEVASLVAQVFAARGVPVAVERRVAFGHTPLGRALAGLLRAAAGGTAQDLLAWLRAPGLVRAPALVDRLEAAVRRGGLRSAAAARERWEARTPGFPLAALDRVAAAAAEGPAALLARAADELAALFAAPHHRAGLALTGADADEAHVLRAGREALDELAGLAALDPALVPGPAGLAALLERLEVDLGDRPAAGAVAVTDPLRVRARRVRALVVCRLQDGVLPAAGRPEPFLGDAQRRALNAASGLRLEAGREDALGAERALFYALASRPEERLVLSWHTADDDGEPLERSPFVDEVERLLDGVAVRRRAAGAVGAAGEGAPGDRERRRAQALAGPRMAERRAAPLTHPAVLARLRDRPAWSASALEAWAGCPVRWFVERLLRPDGLEPDPEQLVRGTLAHAVLEQALRRLTDAGALTPERLPEARAAVREALAELSGETTLSVEPARARALLHRLEADLVRYVEAAATARSAARPAAFEVAFSGLDLGDDVRVDGTIDRIDVLPGGRKAVLYDYKGRVAPPAARWLEEGRFQLALYALAARRLLDLEPVGALYQPLGAPDLRPRGVLREGEDPELRSVAADRRDPDAFASLLDEAVALASAAAGEARAGALVPRPDSCAYDGGCAHPTICRGEAA